jgi:hypothetical protein
MVDMIIGRDRDETIRLTAEAEGISPAEAATMYAIAHGESFGDVIVVDADGDPIPLADADDDED